MNLIGVSFRNRIRLIGGLELLLVKIREVCGEKIVVFGPLFLNKILPLIGV